MLHEHVDGSASLLHFPNISSSMSLDPVHAPVKKITKGCERPSVCFFSANGGNHTEQGICFTPSVPADVSTLFRGRLCNERAAFSNADGNTSLRACSGCMKGGKAVVQYCSRECQKSDVRHRRFICSRHY